jgi:hypothetical protein
MNTAAWLPRLALTGHLSVVPELLGSQQVLRWSYCYTVQSLVDMKTFYHVSTYAHKKEAKTMTI